MGQVGRDDQAYPCHFQRRARRACRACTTSGERSSFAADRQDSPPQLDILGIDYSFLPCQPPFSDALPKNRPEKNPDASEESLSTISKDDLRSALQDQEAFFEMYVALTNRAIELYASAGRRKFALRMHGSLAALDVSVYLSFLIFWC